MSKPSSPMLTCAQCGYENEPERVYCHNCGTKLDRSLLPVETETAQESSDNARKRILKMTRPGGSPFAPVAKFFKTITWAAVVAALALLALPPVGVTKKADESSANIISGSIEDAKDSLRPSTVQFSAIDLSSHARSRIKGASSVPGLTFKRSFVMLGEGTITLGFEQSLFDYPLYSTLTYRLSNVDGKVVAEKAGQHFGRLGIDPRIPGLTGSFEKGWKALKTENALFERAQSITISKGQMVVITKAATAATPPR